MLGNHLKLELNPGTLAPRYGTEVKELKCECAVITENGMESGLPLVDFQLSDVDGNKYFFAISGRIVNSVSAAIKGVNLRNHGVEEP